MARRQIEEINAGSMADIAFLLLIFFLVTTTMATDSGLTRQLPPIAEDNIDPPEIKERNIFVVLVNKNDELLVEGRLMDIKDLRDAAKEFIANPNKDPDLPEFRDVDIDYFGIIPITKLHVISLQNDNGTSYKTYIAVQNELTAAYYELRDELAIQKFGMKYNDMKEEDSRKDAIEKVYPLKISEAEPKNIGGTL